MDLFWRQGYEATSLDDLTRAMRVSRSSFYATFGSKHQVLIAAVQRYSDGILNHLKACASEIPDAGKAFDAMIAIIADPQGDEKGCLFVNSVAELVPRDTEMAALARQHIGRVTALLTGTLAKSGIPAREARVRSSAALSLAFGATILRKAGVASRTMAALVQQAGKQTDPI